LDGRQIFRKDCSETSLETREGMPSNFKWSQLMLDLSKITKAKRIEEVVLIHMWPSGIKALPDTNSYF
jgi:hypothetical protein